MKLLHIDSSIDREASISRTLSAGVFARLLASDPVIEVVRRDLTAAPLAHLLLSDMPAPGVGFIGVTPEFVIAEGVLLAPAQRELSLAKAQQSISALSA